MAPDLPPYFFSTSAPRSLLSLQMISSVLLLALGVANAAEWYEDACFTDCWSSCDNDDCNLCDYYGDACAADCSAEVQAEFKVTNKIRCTSLKSCWVLSHSPTAELSQGLL